MKKMRMCFPREKTFEDGFKEYVLDCKARNLREGTINHYQESIKQGERVNEFVKKAIRLRLDTECDTGVHKTDN